jgi:hypothetical protein
MYLENLRKPSLLTDRVLYIVNFVTNNQIALVISAWSVLMAYEPEDIVLGEVEEKPQDEDVEFADEHEFQDAEMGKKKNMAPQSQDFFFLLDAEVVDPEAPIVQQQSWAVITSYFEEKG